MLMGVKSRARSIKSWDLLWFRFSCFGRTFLRCVAISRLKKEIGGLKTRRLASAQTKLAAL